MTSKTSIRQYLFAPVLIGAFISAPSLVLAQEVDEADSIDRSDIRRSDVDRADRTRPDVDRPDRRRTDLDRPDRRRPDVERPDRRRTDTSSVRNNDGRLGQRERQTARQIQTRRNR